MLLATMWMMGIILINYLAHLAMTTSRTMTRLSAVYEDHVVLLSIHPTSTQRQ
jgi:hypothetical protein